MSSGTRFTSFGPGKGRRVFRGGKENRRQKCVERYKMTKCFPNDSHARRMSLAVFLPAVWRYSFLGEELRNTVYDVLKIIPRSSLSPRRKREPLSVTLNLRSFNRGCESIVIPVQNVCETRRREGPHLLNTPRHQLSFRLPFFRSQNIYYTYICPHPSVNLVEYLCTTR